jgi:hypothetical protein
MIGAVFSGISRKIEILAAFDLIGGHAFKFSIWLIYRHSEGCERGASRKQQEVGSIKD